MDLNAFESLPLMGILRGIEEKHIEPLAETVFAAGLENIEITMNTVGAAGLIRQLVDVSKGRLTVGAGTVLTVEDLEKAVELHSTFYEMINLSFGIGTNLTNDMGVAPPDIVIKMVECNGQPVAKISDSDDKEMCEDPEFSNYLKRVFSIQ